jgi:putative phosphoribosyl transferase
MIFKDRVEAGKLLARALENYKDEDTVILALPRGGVVVGAEIANYLKAPLDLVIVRKIGHPFYPEYAIGAISEEGLMIGSKEELASVDQKWLEQEKENQVLEAKRRRKAYLLDREKIPLNGKSVIIVDDGIATGLTMLVAIDIVKQLKPAKIIVATPLSSKKTADRIGAKVDAFIGLEVPQEHRFLGAVGAYYHEFFQVTDEEVIAIMKRHTR